MAHFVSSVTCLYTEQKWPHTAHHSFPKQASSLPVCQLYYLPETVVRRSPISLKINNILFTHFRNGWHADSSFPSSTLRSPKVCLLDLCLEILHAENLQVEHIEVLRRTGRVYAAGSR